MGRGVVGVERGSGRVETGHEHVERWGQEWGEKGQREKRGGE